MVRGLAEPTHPRYFPAHTTLGRICGGIYCVPNPNLKPSSFLAMRGGPHPRPPQTQGESGWRGPTQPGRPRSSGSAVAGRGGRWRTAPPPPPWQTLGQGDPTKWLGGLCFQHHFLEIFFTFFLEHMMTSSTQDDRKRQGPKASQNGPHRGPKREPLSQ